MKVLPLRRILLAVGALAAALIYVIWWVTYAAIHLTPRYSTRPPGAAAEVAGTSVRLLSLVRSDELRDAMGGQPEFPAPGAVWIVAELEMLRHDSGKTFYCDIKVLGPQGRVWPEAAFQVQRATSDCDIDNPVGQPVRVESVFMVPARYVDQLMGIALEDGSTPARTPVIRPL
jgi:hypothetical protein